MTNMNNSDNVQLKKSLKPVNVWALALGSIIGWGAFVMPGTSFLPGGGPMGTVIGMAAAVVVMFIIALNYGYMVQKYPVAGGEYTFTVNTMGETHAYICGWFLGLAYIAIVPLNATALTLVSRKLLGGIFEFGHLYTLADWDIYVGEILVSTAVLVIFAYLSIVGISTAGKIQTVMTFVLVGSVVVLLAAALISPDADFNNLKPAYPDGVSPVGAIGAIVAVAPWAFVGFDSIPQAAEEFDFSHAKTTRLMFLSIVFAAFIYIAMTVITALVWPWQETLAMGHDWATGEAVESLLGKFGIIVMGFAIVCAILSGIVGFYMATSRLLYSMAKEKTLPGWFSRLDAKHSTPKNAIIFIMLISAVAPWFGREVLTWIVDMSSVGAAVGFGYTSLATFLTLRKDKECRQKWLYVTSIAGTLISAAFIVLLLVPGMPGYLSPEARICLVVWIVLGVIFRIRARRNAA